MPNGLIGPAKQANPSLMINDIIIGVNGEQNLTYNEIKQNIIDSHQQVDLIIERTLN